MKQRKTVILAGSTFVVTLLFGSVAAFASPKKIKAAAHSFNISDKTDDLLSNYCYDCHDADTQKGDIRLDNLADYGHAERLDLLNKIQEQVYFKHMPPKKKDQPDEAERKELLTFASKELGLYKASTLEGKLKKPEYGNYIDHEKLFSGEYKDLPAYTYDRRWLISEFIFSSKFQRILQHKPMGKRYGKRLSVLGSQKINGISLTNPFLLPKISGVRYYANEDFTGGHLSSMLTNGQKVSEYITGYLVKRHRKYLTAINEVMALDDQHHKTLESRREFLDLFIARYCEELYGDDHVALLPKFQPVTLKKVKKLEKGEKYKKAPIHVAQNMLKGLEADKTVFYFLQDPLYAKKSDKDFQMLCEKTWFYFGDHERKIQGRMTLLRDYLPDFRKGLDKLRRKYKPVVYKPLSDSEMEVIAASIKKHRKKGDFYKQIIEKCVKDWETAFKNERIAAGPPSDELLLELVRQLSEAMLERAPTSEESEEYLALSKSYVKKLGKLKAVQKLIQTFILSSEFVYRQEFGSGTADKHGRMMLTPRDASYAIAYALTDQSPDEQLKIAAATGKLSTKEDYEREVLRLLGKRDLHYLIDSVLEDKNYYDNTTNASIRKLRFFREFFGYPAALTIFKDEKRFGGDRLQNATSRLLNETDRLVEHVLENDKNVFEELLTTEKFFVYHDGDNDKMQTASDRIKSIYHYFKDLDWKNFKKKDLLTHSEFLKKVKMRSVNPDKLDARNRQGNTLQLFKKSMTTITARLNKGQKEAAPYDLYRGYGNDFMTGYNVSKFFNLPMDNWDYKTQQPAKVANRKGLLTHPAWLIAHAQNTETDPVLRGKWIREKLLAGTIPHIPITVDAVIPEDHGQTLRGRLAIATEETYCWKCHEGMNPLGYAFESYDDFGRFRTKESLEYPDKLVKKGAKKAGLLVNNQDIYETLPVNPKGVLKGTGDPKLDGDVRDAIDLAERLGKSRRVRQSIIRHAFRYFMGRNEFLSDSKTLIDAEKAYVDSEGSFDAVIVSLLTSDSFIYRKPIED